MAVLYEVGKTAKQTVEEIAIYFNNKATQNVVLYIFLRLGCSHRRSATT